VADHLTDADTAKLPTVMFEQHDLSPTSPEWLSNWETIMNTSDLLSQVRPLTRTAAMNALEAVYESVKDMPGYRMPLADLVFQFCRRQAAEEKEDSEGEVMWRILGEEVVLRSVDCHDTEPSGENSVVVEYMTLLTVVAAGTNEDDYDDDDTASVYTVETHSPSPLTSTGPSNSPTLSRMQSDYPNKDKDTNLPSVMSLISSLTTGPSSRSQSLQPHEHEDQSLEVSNTPPTESTTLPRAVGAVIALVGIFSQLAFTPYALTKENLDLAVRIYDTFITLMVKGKSSKARLAILQFMMRTRADRDHRMYFVDAAYDPDGCFSALASLIDRAAGAKGGPREEPTGDSDFLRKARARFPQERDGRRVSRGRGTRVSHSESSRSRSRATRLPLRGMSAHAAKPRDPTWQVPESLPFMVFNADTPSEGLMSYDPVRGEHEHVLQLSDYLTALINILDKEKNWEILSYVLCQLPVQLANKHLFCGPKCRELLANLLTTLCTGLISGELASEVDRWPQGLKTRDAQGLAYHTVSVLISYRRCFDGRQQHILVEVLQAGLNGQPSAIKCCLHGLSLAAFELQSSMKKYLSRILEKLSQIMSNPEMAVHILSFLVLVGSLRELHYNFTEGDFKMVFGLALQYLQHYNRPGSSPTTSWALSQHLRLVSYYTIYSWFLAVKLPDRPRHIPYITRQLLLANEGKEEVDEPTEVCFDWLARYTYASADPRPANSLLSDIVMNPTTSAPSEVVVTEKTWIMGNAFVTIRTLARLGWIEILSRRPSGYTKFLCRVENVPMVGTGDVDPDMMSVPASLIMERGPAEIEVPTTLDASDESVTQAMATKHLLEVSRSA
jgi:tuberous sclerosis 2